MKFYQLFMFLHIACVIVWLGCGMALSIMGSAAMRRNDRESLVTGASRDFALFNRVSGPAALGALVFGLAMTFVAWDFHELWILIGLAGFAASATYGGTALRHGSQRLASALRKYGQQSTLAVAEAERLLVLARFDVVMLFVIVADMVFKPEPGDVATLALMAAVLAAGAAGTWLRLRTMAAARPRS